MSLRARIAAAVGLVLLIGGLIATFLPLSAHASQEGATARQLTTYVRAAESLASTSSATVSTTSLLSSVYVAKLTDRCTKHPGPFRPSSSVM